MSRQSIDVGTSPNDNTGDPLRTAMQKTEANFVELYATDLLSVSTSGSTITLTFGSGVLAHQRRFFGSASFATPKTIALASDSEANHFTFLFTITDVAATLTFPASFKSSDFRFASLVFTALEIGTYKMTADYDGNSWYVDFSPLPYV